MDQREIEELQAKYKLTEEEYKQYYHAINLFFTTGKKPEENPKLVFVAGQAGAGKSRLVPVVNKKLSYNAVISDYDIVRSMHPKFELASKENKENIHLALLPDADRANQEIRDYCRENKLNLIYEGTMRATAGFLKMAREFKEAGYEIDLELMSVPKLESYSSTFLRYAMQLISNSEPRWVPKSVHDASYDNFLVTLKEFEKEGLFDHATVYKRGDDKPEPFYSTEGREFQKPSEAVLYGREMFNEDLIRKFPMKYEMIYTVFSESAPTLMPYVGELFEMYEMEKNGNKIEENKKEREDRDD